MTVTPFPLSHIVLSCSTTSTSFQFFGNCAKPVACDDAGQTFRPKANTITLLKNAFETQQHLLKHQRWTITAHCGTWQALLYTTQANVTVALAMCPYFYILPLSSANTSPINANAFGIYANGFDSVAVPQENDVLYASLEKGLGNSVGSLPVLFFSRPSVPCLPSLPLALFLFLCFFSSFSYVSSSFSYVSSLPLAQQHSASTRRLALRFRSGAQAPWTKLRPRQPCLRRRTQVHWDALLLGYQRIVCSAQLTQQAYQSIPFLDQIDLILLRSVTLYKIFQCEHTHRQFP